MSSWPKEKRFRSVAWDHYLKMSKYEEEIVKALGFPRAEKKVIAHGGLHESRILCAFVERLLSTGGSEPPWPLPPQPRAQRC